jgi:hypothetical protein
MKIKLPKRCSIIRSQGQAKSRRCELHSIRNSSRLSPSEWYTKHGEYRKRQIKSRDIWCKFWEKVVPFFRSGKKTFSQTFSQ